MTAALLSIGTELTRGELVNTNAAWLGEELTKLGFDVVEHATVDDDLDRIATLIHRFAAAHRVVVATGGLGPTSDDLTTAAAAHAARVELRRDESVVEGIRQKFKAFGRVMPRIEREAGRLSRRRRDSPESGGHCAWVRDDPWKGASILRPGRAP